MKSTEFHNIQVITLRAMSVGNWFIEKGSLMNYTPLQCVYDGMDEKQRWKKGILLFRIKETLIPLRIGKDIELEYKRREHPESSVFDISYLRCPNCKERFSVLTYHRATQSKYDWNELPTHVQEEIEYESKHGRITCIHCQKRLIFSKPHVYLFSVANEKECEEWDNTIRTFLQAKSY